MQYLGNMSESVGMLTSLIEDFSEMHNKEKQRICKIARPEIAVRTRCNLGANDTSIGRFLDTQIRKVMDDKTKRERNKYLEMGRLGNKHSLSWAH